MKARNKQNHKFNFDEAFQIQEQKPQQFKIFQANNRVWPKFESKKKNKLIINKFLKQREKKKKKTNQRENRKIESRI